MSILLVGTLNCGYSEGTKIKYGIYNIFWSSNFLSGA